MLNNSFKLMKEEINWKIIADEMKDNDLIPVVGPELLKMEINGQIQNYRFWLANELARELDLPTGDLSELLHPIQEVMLEFYRKGDIRSIRPYQAVKALMGEKAVQIPQALVKLASIQKFRFFLTTMFEPFLEMAMNEAWASGKESIRVLENNLASQPDDLKKFTQRTALQQFDVHYINKLYKGTAPPSIYYLYGRPSRTRTYALSEDDVLEANLMLYNSIYRPDELINFLSQKRLVVLGCNFPNWLARFFISLTSPDPKRPVNQPVFVIGDTVCKSDKNLADYLRRIDAQIVCETTLEAFIDKLYELWQGIKENETVFYSDENPFEEQSVFISYASENKEIAVKLFGEIKSIGLPVWLDKKELKPGDQWAGKIESNLRNCSIFLPLISEASINADTERYFHKEWTLAIKLQESAGSIDFPILPILIETIPGDTASIPLEFKSLHWIEAPEGNISDDSLSLINQVFQKRKNK